MKGIEGDGMVLIFLSWRDSTADSDWIVLLLLEILFSWIKQRYNIWRLLNCFQIADRDSAKDMKSCFYVSRNGHSSIPSMKLWTTFPPSHDSSRRHFSFAMYLLLWFFFVSNFQIKLQSHLACCSLESLLYRISSPNIPQSNSSNKNDTSLIYRRSYLSCHYPGTARI
jgi:hypothetical protein